MSSAIRRSTRTQRAQRGSVHTPANDASVASDEVTNRDMDHDTAAVLSDEEIGEGQLAEEEEEVEEEDEEEEFEQEIDDQQLLEDDIFPPPGLKEISSLASWTVSTAKPGNGVAALRSPDTNLFWQSDGPQPHLLSIHFFKLVAIVQMRIFLDFDSDESYTPTKIQFLAGMGVHDIQEFAEMAFESPSGWIDVDFSNVGPILEDDEDDDERREGRDDGAKEIDWSKRPVLRAFLIQVRILENHQNGKDTHLRAVQLFARDHDSRTARRPAPDLESEGPAAALPSLAGLQLEPTTANNIKLAPWMMDPELR